MKTLGLLIIGMAAIFAIALLTQGTEGDTPYEATQEDNPTDWDSN